MDAACPCCGGDLGPGVPPPHGLCPACYARLEAELADAAERYGRPARSDAETVADEPLPEGFARPAVPPPPGSAATGPGA